MPGRTCYCVGLILMALFATGHFMGFLQARKAARTDPALADLTRAMREHRSRVLGFEPSILDFREYFSLNFSILLAALAAAGLIALRTSTDPAAIIRGFSLLYALLMIALLLTSWMHAVVQGLISCSLILAAFAVAYIRSA